MKKGIVISMVFLISSFAIAQKKEKIKGSKIVTTIEKNCSGFENLEINDALEVFLVKGSKAGIKIEADDNLHDIITIDTLQNSLRIGLLKNATAFKKLSLKITYTNVLKKITSHNEAIINCIEPLVLNAVSVETYDSSKAFINAQVETFALQLDDKSSVELNLKSSTAKIVLSKDSNLKALINSADASLDMYQKSEAVIEGDVALARIRTDHNSRFLGNKFTIKTANIVAENHSKATINATELLTLDAKNEAEIKLIGTPKIEITNFLDEVKLIKVLK